MKDNKELDWKTALWKASSVGFVMVFSVLIGLGAGWWLDDVFNTSPVIMIVGIFTGMFSGFYSIWQIMKELM